ncbi:MAG: sigma-54-dependent Fis family transcriptional regulator [Azonexus sp.]|jgi:transcriptional regulator of acetoin/glycerol metabolism|nr:sigma-54-dependent Fis family transcriptional regulator [Azonexus sp.]
MAIREGNSDTLPESERAQVLRHQRKAALGSALPQAIEASWQRSFNYGLDCRRADGPQLRNKADLEALQQSNRLLLDAALPGLDYLQRHQGQNSLIILTDAEASILSIEGARHSLRQSGLKELTPGACWNEKSCGTNALGTMLVERRALQVNGGQHFLDALSRFSCTAVPIFNPGGELAGVLDLTTEGGQACSPESLSLLNMAASQIESRLFVAAAARHIVLAFHSHRQYLDSPWQGLIALNPEGRVLAASAQACALLGMTRETLLNRPCASFLDADSRRRLEGLQQGDVGNWQTLKGEFFYKALQTPPRSLIVPAFARPAKRPPLDGPDPALRQLTALAGHNERYARTLRAARQGLLNDLPVLLLGETGSGKEMLARALHQSSGRSNRAFVAVNCAAIPETLIESELFGYREGAFTGSRRGGMVGRLRQAHGGTLFLDEIGDMPLTLQARLLRVLQERRVAPLGAAEEEDIDIALICATHCDLKRLVEEKLFREDLYYRINGISVRLPALRERDDINDLMAAMLTRLGAPKVRLDKELTALLTGYHWPGNIRQLEMVLRAALAMREDGELQIGLDHLPDSTLEELSARERPVCSGRIRENELELIRQSLERYQGNVSAAADALGISRATLYRKLKQLD